MTNPRVIKTGLLLEDLTDEHIKKIRELYDAANLPRDDIFLGEDHDAYYIKSQIKHGGAAELRPIVAYEPAGKFNFSYWIYQGERYLEIGCGVQSNPLKKINLERAIKKFYKSMHSEFG